MAAAVEQARRAHEAAWQERAEALRAEARAKILEAGSHAPRPTPL